MKHDLFTIEENKQNKNRVEKENNDWTFYVSENIINSRKEGW